MKFPCHRSLGGELSTDGFVEASIGEPVTPWDAYVDE
jgi:hypothetical protein